MDWQGTFPPEGRSAAAARTGVVEVLTRLKVPAEVVDDVVAAVGELASNAARHARTEYTVTVAHYDGVVRIEVFDHDTRPPALLGLDDDSTSGRGLHIVSTIATDWGWHSASDSGDVAGKVVWAEFTMDK